jgi:hypothetical protein
MGFNKKYVLPKHNLQQLVYDHGVEYVVTLYSKADALVGDSDSIQYLHSLENILKENKK